MLQRLDLWLLHDFPSWQFMILKFVICRLQHLWKRMWMLRFRTTPTFHRSYYAFSTMWHCMYERFKLCFSSFFKLKSLTICWLEVLAIFQADPETDEVYAQMTLQPVPSVSTSMADFVLCLFFWLENYKLILVLISLAVW